ncbi:MAG: TIGR02449 family protein [Motiliproteus sp.]|nr:TIGR02449 family protein [Motiliproteus sp.]MCW9051364.1 TIGR02449 family protein [Motiliproteus sp.]
MSNQNLQQLEQQIDLLIGRCQQLQQQNQLLQRRENSWKTERAKLIQSRDSVQAKVEAMITRLKAMEQQ